MALVRSKLLYACVGQPFCKTAIDALEEQQRECLLAAARPHLPPDVTAEPTNEELAEAFQLQTISATIHNHRQRYLHAHLGDLDFETLIEEARLSPSHRSPVALFNFIGPLEPVVVSAPHPVPFLPASSILY